MEFEEFLRKFKALHQDWFRIDSGRSVAVKAPMPEVEAKAPEIKPQVAKEVVLEDDWDGAEEVEVEQDEYWK